MKFESSVGPTVAAIVLTSLFYACATQETKTAGTREELLLVPEQGQAPDNSCTWTVNRAPSQNNKVKDPIVINSNAGKCSVDTPSSEFYIGTTSGSGMKVTVMEAKYFRLQGSCKYCYPNTSGGMSCVTYPGPPC
jgi:hypothetical protein